MKLALVLLLLVWIATCGCVSSAAQGSFLDTYLHNIEIDQESPWRTRDNQARFLKSGEAFGQTFVTGPDVEEIHQIAVQSPHYNQDWQDGVSLVMALYDSPAKHSKLSEFEMKYEWRSWEDMVVVFPMNAPARPNTSYYFELTTRGGSGQVGNIMVASADYPNGQAYIGGKPQDFDFAFQTYVRTTWDRDATYRQAFAMFDLDYPGMEAVKSAVQAKRWDEAAKALVAHFEARPAFKTIASQPKGRTIPDLTLADLAAEMKIKDADGNILSLGPNWNHLKWWPTRGGVGLTREGIRKYLAAGYFNTGDRKYAIAWTDMIKAVLTDLPSPIKAGVVPPDAKDIAPIFPGGIAGGSMWAGLSIGARLAHEFYYYAIFANSPDFPWDVRAAFIMNLGDMADVLAIEKGGGNWATQMFDHLFYFSTEFPEFARSREYARYAFDGLISNMRETMLPDGPIGESAGYQMMVHGQYLDVMDRARGMGLQIPDDVVDNAEKALEFHMYTIQPDHGRPPFGDALGDDPRPLLKRGAEEFGRKDMLWVATDGAEGTMPEHLSIEFPYSKYYVMRSDWTPDARYLILKNGRYAAHGHFDSLGFELFAYGNPVFIDPGIYIYGTPGAVRLISTQSHNTISVDGANLQNGGGPNQFFTGQCLDYINAVGPSYQGLDNSIYPARRVAFLKPDYWVISDVICGRGEHQVDSRFHYANTSATVDNATQVATTTYAEGGNLSLIPVGAAGMTSVLEDADTAYVHEKLAPALILRRSVKGELPLRMDNVAYPYEGDSAGVVVSPLSPVAGRAVETSGMKIETPRGTDYVVFTHGPTGAAAFAEADLRLKGQFACVRRDNSGAVRSFAWISGTRLDNGSTLARSEQPIPGLDVVYDGGTVYVTTRGSHPSLSIASFGCSRASINGGPARAVDVRNGMFKPFDAGPADADSTLAND